MILFVFIWLYIFLISFPIGFGAIRILGKMFTNKEDSINLNFGFDFLSIFGLIFITVFLSYISLFYKIGLFCNIVLSFLACCIYYYHRKKIFLLFKKSVENKDAFFFTSISILIILFYSTHSPAWYDTELYHAQTIKWTSTFPVVPGLGNLHGRLAFNSHSFLLQSLFDVSQINLKYFNGKSIIVYPLNSFLLLILINRLFLKIKYTITHNQVCSFIFYLCIFIITISSEFIIPLSPSPVNDTVLYVFVFYLVLFYLEYFEFSEDFTCVLFSIMIIYIPTIKISGLLYFSILPFIFKYTLRNFKFIIGCIIIVLIPFFLRNYILSGYLIYPFPNVDLFEPDWKMPIKEVIEEKNWIESWGRLAKVNSNEVLNMPMKYWIPLWFSNLSFSVKLFFLLNLLSPVFFINSILKRKNKMSILYFVLILNLVFWFFTSPDYRFGFPTIIILFSLIFSEIGKLRFVNSVFNFINIKWLYPIAIIIAWLSFYNNKDFMITRFLFPDSIKEAKTITLKKNNIIYMIPSNNDDRCFNSTLPCTPCLNENLIMRGKNLRDGFKVIH